MSDQVSPKHKQGWWSRNQVIIFIVGSILLAGAIIFVGAALNHQLKWPL